MQKAGLEDKTTPAGVPLVRIAELEIHAEHLDSYTNLLKEEIDASIAREPGVRMLLAMAIRGNPTTLRIVEIYSDSDAYELHLKSAHFLKYKAATAGMVRSLRLVETDPIVLGGWTG